VTEPKLADLKAALSVLVIDDDRTIREGCRTVLESEGFRVTVQGRGDEALDLVKRKTFDIVLIDQHMTPVHGLELLKACLVTSRDTLAIVMTGNPSVAASLEALRLGAWDYLPKPFSASHLEVMIGRAVHVLAASRAGRAPEPATETPSGHSDRVTLLGISPSLRQAVDLARKVAATDASVMITGESGTGKEVIAQFIHRHSRRSSSTLVAINCAALPETLLESELFGHRRGSFTGADRDKPGLLETANGGTLFLDELTEMSMQTQAKLLRVLQDGVVRRVGSEREDAHVDVRFISATNRDPRDAVGQGRLRADLMYRLRVVPIHLPPLRHRPEDIPILANHFLAQTWQRHRRAGESPPVFTPDAIAELERRQWPGNVRELQNVVEHTVVLSAPGATIAPDDIPPADDAMPGEVGGDMLPSGVMSAPYHVAKEQLLAHFDRMYISSLLTRAGRNVSKAARIAGIDRTTLYRLMERYDLKRDGDPGE
jgi:DNA-binding NtrC family response regulator